MKKRIEYDIVILEPSDENNYLTNGEIYVKIVYLGSADNEENWQEVNYAPVNNIDMEDE